MQANLGCKLQLIRKLIILKNGEQAVVLPPGQGEDAKNVIPFLSPCKCNIASVSNWCFATTDEKGQQEWGFAVHFSEGGAMYTVCILSQWPFIEVFQLWLNSLAVAACQGTSVEGALLNLVYELPAPPRGRLKINICTPLPEIVLSLERPPLNSYPMVVEDASLLTTMQVLPVAAILEAVNSLMLERKVVIFSPHRWMLAPVALTLRSLLFPLEWEHAFIPHVPEGCAVSDLLQAPVPLLLGVTSSRPAMEEAIEGSLNTLFLDLSDGTAIAGPIDMPLPLLPENVQREVVAELIGFEKKVFDPVRAQAEAQSRLEIVAQLCSSKPVDCSSQFRQVPWSGAQPFRHAFAKLMTSLLSGYREFATDRNGFLKSRPSWCSDYVAAMCETVLLQKMFEKIQPPSDGGFKNETLGMLYFDRLCQDGVMHDSKYSAQRAWIAPEPKEIPDTTATPIFIGRSKLHRKTLDEYIPDLRGIRTVVEAHAFEDARRESAESHKSLADSLAAFRQSPAGSRPSTPGVGARSLFKRVMSGLKHRASPFKESRQKRKRSEISHEATPEPPPSKKTPLSRRLYRTWQGGMKGSLIMSPSPLVPRSSKRRRLSLAEEDPPTPPTMHPLASTFHATPRNAAPKEEQDRRQQLAMDLALQQLSGSNPANTTLSSFVNHACSALDVAGWCNRSDTVSTIFTRFLDEYLEYSKEECVWNKVVTEEKCRWRVVSSTIRALVCNNSLDSALQLLQSEQQRFITDVRASFISQAPTVEIRVRKTELGIAFHHTPCAGGFLVTGFSKDNALQQDGFVHIGDVLLSINAVNISEKPHKALMDLLRCARRPIRLKFARLPQTLVSRLSPTMPIDIQAQLLASCDIELNTLAATECPQCLHRLTEVEVSSGFAKSSPNEYRTTCPRCSTMFVARFSVIIKKDSLIWCEYLSDDVLQKEVEKVVLSNGREALELKRLHKSHPALYWNTILRLFHLTCSKGSFVPPFLPCLPPPQICQALHFDLAPAVLSPPVVPPVLSPLPAPKAQLALVEKVNLFDQAAMLATQVQELRHAQSTLRQSSNALLGFVQHTNSSLARAFRKLNTAFALESSDRRRIQNELQELKGNVRVFCRVRSHPGASDCECMLVKDRTTVQVVVPGSSTSKEFSFDHVFSSGATQEQVFQELQPMVSSVVKGINGTVFAYGQTGSGKTYTMLGGGEGTLVRSNDTEGTNGVIPRAFHELFTTCAAEKARGVITSFDVRVSMLELYNETMRDLIGGDADQEISIRQRKDKHGAEVIGLHEQAVHSVEEAIECIQCGSKRRVVADNAVNAQSSRAHTAVFVRVETTRRMAGAAQVTSAKLVLVDLAGSERLSVTGAMPGSRQIKETQCINKSLSALGNVIGVLAWNAHHISKEKRHVPYRDSKLTYFLQDSLGGDAKTIMIVAASPLSAYHDESLCSLQFGTRARSVRNAVSQHTITQGAGASAKEQKLQSQNQRLLESVDALKSELEEVKKHSAAVLQKSIKQRTAVSTPDRPPTPSAPGSSAKAIKWRQKFQEEQRKRLKVERELAVCRAGERSRRKRQLENETPRRTPLKKSRPSPGPGTPFSPHRPPLTPRSTPGSAKNRIPLRKQPSRLGTEQSGVLSPLKQNQRREESEQTEPNTPKEAPKRKKRAPATEPAQGIGRKIARLFGRK